MSRPFESVLGESTAVVTALQCGALEALADEALTVGQLSARLELDPDGLARLVELLESMRVLEREDDRYRLAVEHRESLRKVPGSLIGLRHLWGALPNYLRNGRPLMVHSDAERRGPAYASVVSRLARMFEASASRLAEQLPHRRRNVLDVGAGSGVWSLAMAQRDPQLRVTALDRPEVLPRFLERAEALGLSDRVSVVDGDYNEVELRGLGYDRVILANVLHLEDEADAARLIQRAAAGLDPGGELVTVDAFPSDDLETRRQYDMYRLHLAMRTGGRRAHAESRLRDWYREAGFEARELLRLDPGQPEIGALIAQAA